MLKSYALTTAARLSAYLGIDTPTGAQLTVMETFINAVTDFIEHYTGRRFQQATYTNEEYNTEKSETLNLNNYPISTFTSLQRRNSGVNEDDWETIDSSYYHVNEEEGIIELAGEMKFNRTRKGYRVTYIAGYDFDNSTDYLGDTEASDVEFAAWSLASDLWLNKGLNTNIKRESLGEYSVEYFGPIVKCLMTNPNLEAILDKYKSNDSMGVLTPTQN